MKVWEKYSRRKSDRVLIEGVKKGIFTNFLQPPGSIYRKDGVVRTLFCRLGFNFKRFKLETKNRRKNDRTSIKKKLTFIQEQLAHYQVSVVNQWGLEKKDEIGVQRFFNNKRVEVKELISNIKQSCADRCPRGHILLLQDTCELNYNSLNGRLKVNDPDIGVLSDDRSTGICVHPGLAMEADTGLPIGYGHLNLFVNRFGRPTKHERDYKNLPIEEKQSYRWLETIEQSEGTLEKAEKITVIADRESDIYEILARNRGGCTELLIRSSWDRLVDEGIKLSERLAEQAWGERTIVVPISGNDQRTAREAELKIRWRRVAIRKPRNRKKLLEQYPDSIAVQVVEVLEEAHSVPQGESPVYWRLLTTHSVDCLQEALQILSWYTQRWWIEELFRLIKTKGFQIESSQFSTGAALQKLIVLTLEQALKVLVMKQEREGKKKAPASICFTQEEQELLQVLQAEVEGNTEKQKNPHPRGSLAWAVWLIARLGGWTPADLKKRPPGVITLLRGLKNFNQRFEGWRLAMIYHRKIFENSKKTN